MQYRYSQLCDCIKALKNLHLLDLRGKWLKRDCFWNALWALLVAVLYLAHWCANIVTDNGIDLCVPGLVGHNLPNCCLRFFTCKSRWEVPSRRCIHITLLTVPSALPKDVARNVDQVLAQQSNALDLKGRFAVVYNRMRIHSSIQITWVACRTFCRVWE